MGEATLDNPPEKCRWWEGDNGEGPNHLWEVDDKREDDLEWPAGNTSTSGNPAACGVERRGHYVGPISYYYDSLDEWLKADDTCHKCALKLADRLNITPPL